MSLLVRRLAARPFLAFVALVGGGLALAPPAHAGCCRVVKVDPATPSTLVQVCEPGGSVESGGEVIGGCERLLFSGTLALGEGQEVCTAAPTVVYREWDARLGAFGPPVEARCEVRDVEI